MTTSTVRREPGKDLESLLDDLRRGEEPARKAALLRLAKERELRALPLMRRLEQTDESMEIRFLLKKALAYLSERALVETPPPFDDPSPRDRIAALENAALRGDAELLPHVLERVSEEDEPEVRRILVTTLGILGSREHAGIFDRFLDDGDPDTRLRTLEALEHLDDVSNYPLYVRFSNDGDPRVRRTAVRALGRLGRKRMIRLCLALARSNRVELVQNSLRILVGLKTEEAIPCFEKCLTSPDAAQRELARAGLDRLAEMGDAEAIRVLKTAGLVPMSGERSTVEEQTLEPEGLRSMESSARLDAVLRIEESGDREGVEAIVQHLEQEKEPRVRATMVRVIGRLGLPSHLGAVNQLLRDPHDRVRANAVEAYSALTDQADRRPLQFLLRDSNNRVRTNAILALWGLGLKEVREALILLSKGDTARDRLSAIYAINQIGEQAGNLLGAMCRDTNEEVRTKAEECRRLLGLSSSAEFLTLEPDPDPEPEPPPETRARAQTGVAERRKQPRERGATTGNLLENVRKELSTASFRISAELKGRLARQQVERVLEDIGEEYFRSCGRRVPDDEALTRELITALGDESRGRKAVATKLQDLGRRVRDEALGTGDRIETLISRLVKAEEDLRRLEGELKLIGKRSLFKQLKILVIVAIVLTVLVGIMMYTLVPGE